MMYLPVLILMATFCKISAHDDDLPEYIKPCNIEKDIDACVKERINQILPRFAEGIPEMKVPSLEPVHINDIVLDQENLKLKFTEVKMHGLSNMTATKFDFNLENATFSLGLKGNLSLSSNYTADGHILILPIKGDGEAYIYTKGIDVNITAKFKNVTDKEGHFHLKLFQPTYKYDMQSTTFDFRNLFNGNKQLAEATLKFANENWQQLMDDLAPSTIQQIATTIVKTINKFLARVSLNKLFEGADNVIIA